MPVMHQAALDMLKLFVKWQFWGCKFRRQICQLQLFCKVQSLFLRVNCNYERKLHKHDYYSLFLCAEGADHSR